jgi:penicillin-binding protein 1A
VEKRFSKEEVLERYLNVVYFGNGAYGVEAAADRYFGTRAADVDLAEAALLAALIQAPEHYDPYEKPAAARARRDLVLSKMAEYGFTSENAAEAAKREPVEVRELAENQQYGAAHFVEQVKRLVLDDPAFGETRDERRRLLFQGGLTIETALDTRMQALAEEAVSKVLVDPAHDPEAALVAVDPRNGHVLAYVGGRDFFGDTPYAKFDLASQGKRQAGSSFKPFVLASALAHGISLDTEYPAPSSLRLPVRGDAQPWTVTNFDGDGYGTTDLVDATVFSVNTVYAQLVMDAGPDNVVELADRMGVDSPLLPVPSAALGTNGVSVLDMASAYSTFAADGQHTPPVFVTKVTGPDGTVHYQAPVQHEEVLDAEIAREVNGVLQQVVGRGTGVNARIGRPLAGKTGTGEEHRDAWFVGYTPELTAAVWVGYPEAEIPMTPPRTRAEVTGGLWPAQIFGLFAGAALAETPVSEFAPPSVEDADVTPRPLPDVKGMPAARAVELLEDAGYDVVTYEQASRDYPPGIAVGQDPPARTLASRGDEVTVWIADGPPETTTVPDLLTLPLDDAEALVDDAKLTIDVVEEAEPAPGFVDLGEVWKQAPVAGTRADAGAVVRIWVDI